MLTVMLRRSLSVLGCLAMFACGSDDTAAEDPNAVVGDIRSNVTWKTGTKLTGVVKIFEGAPVEIEPGAKISCVESAQIQVGGTLRTRSGAAHAVISCDRGTGILVAANGTVDLEGIDLENAEIGIETTKQAGLASVTDAKISNSARPFRVGQDSTLNLTRVVATTPTTLRDFDVSVSEVFGKLVAKYLDYQANTNEGIMVMRGGDALVEDSTLKAKNGLDLISSYGGKSLVVRYTTMNGAHCGPHIDASKDADMVPTESFEIDHVTSEQNQYGITIYSASMAGTHIVKESNLQGENAWLDLQGDHGVITFANVFATGQPTIANTAPPVLQLATARIENAKPR